MRQAHHLGHGWPLRRLAFIDPYGHLYSDDLDDVADKMDDLVPRCARNGVNGQNVLTMDSRSERKYTLTCYPTTYPVVELPGIEPGSYGTSSRLLRAQFAMPLLGSPGLANKPK